MTTADLKDPERTTLARPRRERPCPECRHFDYHDPEWGCTHRSHDHEGEQSDPCGCEADEDGHVAQVARTVKPSAS